MNPALKFSSFRRASHVSFAIFGSAILAAWGIARAEEPQTVPMGSGSYSLTLPKSCKPLPEKIYKTAAVSGPTVTGQWWSSLLWQEFSQNLFAHPMGMVCTPEGLAIAYPGAAIVGSENAIMGGGITKEGDLKISHSGMAKFPTAECGGYSDWFVTATFATGGKSLKTSFGHGSPFAFCVFENGDPVVNFDQTPTVWSGAGEAVVGLTVKGNNYGLFGATGTTWSGLDGKVFTNHAGGKPYFSIALLPDNKPATLALFQRYAYSHVTDTVVQSEVLTDRVMARYKVKVNPWEGSETGTLFALYPHQWKYTKTKLTGITYASVRGQMKVGEGSEFVTEVPIQGVLPLFPAEGIGNRERMLGYLRKEAETKSPEFADTYWEGKYLGRLATLSGVAEAAGDADLQKRFVTELKRRLENWFTASPGEDAPLFITMPTGGR